MAKNRIVFSNDFILKDQKVGINTSSPRATLDVVGDIHSSGIVTSLGGFVGDLVGNITGTITGTASTAVSLETARTFEITGDVVAAPITFDGTGNVSLAVPTIQPNSVGLGTDTFGDYVKDITGTSQQIVITGGTGEGSTPTLSLPTNLIAPQDLTVTRDLQVNRNLNVNGNITIGGTSAIIYATELTVSDPDIVIGFRTDAFGNDISNDNTANHGGIAIASTEGTPLVDIFIAGIETTPSTYKKIMWFKEGTFSGLGTDAWLSNYAIGIGSTQFPSGTRLAAGSVQFTENDLAVVRNINASGIITASSFSGTATNATNIIGGDVGDIPYQSATDITTFVDASSASTGQVLLYNGSIPIWSNVNDAAGAFSGITVYDEGNLVGTASSIVSLNFVSPNLIVTATSGANGIATVRMSDNIVGTALSISGISTFSSSVTIDSSGIFVSGIVTATDFNSASDAKLKTNIQTIADPIEKIAQINGVSFNWIRDNKPSMGVIADELQNVLPELVSDADPKTVNYNGLIGLLIEVVKEQQIKIQSLEDRITKLE